MGQVNKSVYGIIQSGTECSSINYPDLSSEYLIINSSFIFTGVWAIVKGFLSESVKSKVQLIGSGSKTEKVLKERIDDEWIPEKLGGKCKANLKENAGPWNDYEIVDSEEKGATVGIRLISDGPDGKIFTP